MSNFHLESSNVIGLHCHNLRQKDYIESLKTNYLKLLLSCYGPKSSYVLIRNSAACDVISSSSSHLMRHLQFFHPSFKYINALVSSQHKIFGVHGLYVGLLCSTLLSKALNFEEDVTSSVINKVSNWVIDTVLCHLSKKPKSIVINVDFGRFDHNLQVVKSVIGSKMSGLSPVEVGHLAMKVIEAHVRTIPNVGCAKFGHVHVSEIVGPSSLATRLIEGVLFRQADYSFEEMESLVGELPKGNIRVVLFNVPLSPDSEFKNGIRWSGEKSLDFTLDEFMLEELKLNLKENKISIISNQKFMHAALIYDLRKSGFFVLERLGTSHANSLVKISGCNAIASILNLKYDINDHTVGVLTSVEAITVEGKCFVSLKSSKLCQNLTIILTGIDEQIVSYMQESIESCIYLLRSSIQQPEYFTGAGCLEAYLAVFLNSLINADISSLSEKFDISPSKIKKVLHLFCSAFLSLSIIPSGGKMKNIYDYAVDTQHKHLWFLDESIMTPTNGDSVIHKSQISDRCVCKLINKDENSRLLNSWIPLAMIKDGYSNDEFDMLSFKMDNLGIVGEFSDVDILKRKNSSHSNSDTNLSIQDDCIIDNYRAKMNSIRLSFEGFLQLYSVGNCIFDK